MSVRLESAAFVRDSEGDFWPSLFKSQEARFFDLGQLRDVEAEMSAKWFADFADGKFPDLGDEVGAMWDSAK